MSIVITASIAIALLLLALLLAKRKKVPADRFLIAYLAFFVCAQVYFYLESDGAFQHSSLMILGRSVYLLGAPLFFHYVYALTHGRSLKQSLSVLTLAPFLVYIAVFVYYNIRVFPSHDIAFNNGLMYIDGSLSEIWTVFVVLFILNEPFYLILFFLALRSYSKNLSPKRSAIATANLSWLKVLFWIWLITSVVLVPASLFSIGTSLIEQRRIDILVQMANVCFVSVAGFYGLRQTTLFADSNVTSPVPVYQRSGMSQEQGTMLHDKLLKVMQTSRPYLDGDLTANGLASMAEMTSNQLSEVLSVYQHQNFFDFVNGYRIEEIKRKMADPSQRHLTLLALALESGFNSKTTFNTIFRKVTGKTPSQYQKDLKTA